MNHSYRLLIASASVVFATVVYAQGTASSSHDSHGSGHAASAHMKHGDMTSSPNAAKAPYDLQFIDTMSAHHKSAIEMAQLVESRSSHDELKQLAKKVIDDQQKEIKQLTEWKQKWYPNEGEAMNMKMPGMMESMKGMSMDKLANAKGDEFDRMFLDMMAKHHQGAIKMAKDAQKKGKHDEVKSLAQQVVDAQTKEVEQMKQWMKEWKLANK
jgi:uncharacterized protein (DUF305 family)